MPRTYICRGRPPHEFVEGTEPYAAMMKHPDNAEMGQPWSCPHDGSSLQLAWNVVETRPSRGDPSTPVPRRDKLALLVVAADVSTSMFTFTDGQAREDGKAWEVAQAIAATLRGLALPAATTARSLLLGLVCFGDRALWVDSSRGEPLCDQPCVRRVSEHVQSALDARPGTDEEVTRLARYIFHDVFTKANAQVGRATSYQAAIDACGALVADARDPARRHALYRGWDELYRDRHGEHLRCLLYSDGEPNEGETKPDELAARCQTALRDRGGLLITASFITQPGRDAEGPLRAMASECPLDHVPCMFPGSQASRFRDIIRMASGGAGFCPECLSRVR